MAPRSKIRFCLYLISLFGLVMLTLMYIHCYNVRLQGHLEWLFPETRYKMLGQRKNETFSAVHENMFYIYSAIADPSLSSIVVNGWEDKNELKRQYKCCYTYSDGNVASRLSGEKRKWLHNVALIARQVVCDISEMKAPQMISMVTQEESCEDATYLLPVYRRAIPSPTFAICAKIAYGKKRATELIEWMEYHKQFGVDKVLIYPYEDLNSEAWRVLEYYSKTWVLEIIPLPYVPRLKEINRTFSRMNKVMWQDEQVVNFDAQERLKPYTYYTLIDTDEYLTMKNNDTTTFVKLMENLLRVYKKVASFTMSSEIHLLDWGKTSDNSALMIGQYGNHTSPQHLEQKLLHVTARLKPGSVWIHSAEAGPWFKNEYANPDVVVLKHFRKCKSKWVKKDGRPCQNHFKKFRNNLLEKSAHALERQVADVKRKLHINSLPVVIA